MRPKGSAAELEQRRRLAVALLEHGMKPAKVAKTIGTSRASVTRWRQAHEKGGPKALAARPHPGRPPRLTAAQRRRLAKLLLRGARKHGYSTDLWTLDRVAEVIAANFGVEYHPGHVWYVLRSMRWSSQKPERRARERDEHAIEQWRQQEWPRIKKRPKKRP
jgi:transposase